MKFKYDCRFVSIEDNVFLLSNQATSLDVTCNFMITFLGSYLQLAYCIPK